MVENLRSHVCIDTFHVLVTCKWYGGFGMKNLGSVEWTFNKYLVKCELIDSYEIEQFVRFDGSTPLNGSFHHTKLKWKDHRFDGQIDWIN